MKIALDAMGGDFGIPITIQGALLAIKKLKDISKIILVGNEDEIKKELNKYSFNKNKIAILHAPEEVTMKDLPSTAIRQKKQSSLALMFELHKNNKVDAVVSAGNTGAIMAFALTTLGRLPLIKRPAIAITLPTITGQPVVLLDIGANSDCNPRNLVEFAYMGSIFAKNVLNIEKPKIGLLSIGEEPSKGNELTVKTHKILATSPDLNFKGNAEGRNIFTGEFDVIVTDGFIGNIIVKHSESLFTLFSKILKDAVKKNPISMIGALLLKPAFGAIKEKLNYENYGGAALLGINGNCIIAHGRSTPVALMNAIKEAVNTFIHKVNIQIEEEMQKINLKDT